MAHFAKLNENNIVEEVIVVSNDVLLDENNNESEEKGIQFCKDLYGDDTIWIQTSYNNSFRKNFAGIGYTYDTVRNAFIPPRPYDSWKLNEETCNWYPPVPEPMDGKVYSWQEIFRAWVPG